MSTLSYYNPGSRYLRPCRKTGSLIIYKSDQTSVYNKQRFLFPNNFTSFQSNAKKKIQKKNKTNKHSIKYPFKCVCIIKRLFYKKTFASYKNLNNCHKKLNTL